jgi:hypothetical protein
MMKGLWALVFIMVGMVFILGVFATVWRVVTLFAIAVQGVLYLSPGVTFGLAALITLLVLGKLVR